MDEPTEDPLFERIAICGVGLLGASLGMAARGRGVAGYVLGVGRNPKRLESAAKMGAIDNFTLDFDEGCSQADLIVLCAPVSVILEQLPQAFAAAPDGAIITDVGSTKGSIVDRAAEAARDGVFFVGSHPMAGSDRSGAANARENLYDGATVLVTPGIHTTDDALERVERFWRAVGMHVLEMLPRRHDHLVGMLSHVPHLAAAAIVNPLADNPGESLDVFRTVAGPGFRDTTRIAMGSVEMWLDICMDNGETLITALDAMMEHLALARAAILRDDREALRRFLTTAADLRRAFDRGTRR